MNITEQQYKSALKTIEQYKLQENQKLLTKDTYTWEDYLKFIPISPGIPTVDDVVITSKRGFDGGNPKEEHLFEKVTITGYCGRDEFYGVNDFGEERFFLDTSYFKIILSADHIINQVS